MNTRNIILYIAALVSACAQAQLHTEKTLIDLGEIGWHCPKTVPITVQNKSRRPVVLNDVRTDCGCLSTQWQKGRLLEAGESLNIAVTYDANTLGHFNKAVRIFTTEEKGEKTTEIRFKGVVVPEAIDYTIDFPYSIGEDIYLSQSTLEFDNVRHGQLPQLTIGVANGSKKDYAPVIMHLPDWLTAHSEPEVIKPGKIGMITFIADPAHVRQYGLTQTSIYVSRHMGDKVGQSNDLQVNLTLLPQISTTPQALRNAPRVEADSIITLTERGGKKGMHATGNLTIRNTGASELRISRMQVYNLGLQVRLNHTTIKPGRSATLRVDRWTDARHNHYKGSQRILLTTNDPNKPQITIHVR